MLVEGACLSSGGGYPEEGSVKKDRKLGKNMGIRSVRMGIRKWRAKAPQGREKGPKKF